MKTTSNKTTLWDEFKKYINSYKTNQLIKRQHIIIFFKDKRMIPKNSKGMTIDVYRNYITQAGFLDIYKRGVYIKRKDIDLTIEKVKNLAYNKNECKRYMAEGV